MFLWWWSFGLSNKLAKLGSRSFEQHGGFQAMKSQLKWAIFEGYNYDIKSSQLTILRP
ncbi:hypothetical protein [Budvicia aquatica]|uniref:hypothetical protein n=1 Tax=Budvicia aquatica TaxID=82979 RepID=UPI00141B2E03|nr:hypothetical protein [Budvicia aquatica]